MVRSWVTCDGEYSENILGPMMRPIRPRLYRIDEDGEEFYKYKGEVYDYITAFDLYVEDLEDSFDEQDYPISKAKDQEG